MNVWHRDIESVIVFFFVFVIYGFDVIVCFSLFAERGVCLPPRTDDDFLIRFLRARFFKLEHAYNLVGIPFICKMIDIDYGHFE